MEVAAEIVMNEEVLRSNGLGFDSSITLEAISPKEYSLSDFSVSKYGDQERRDRYDWIQTYHIALHAEGRQISLLDWYSSEVRLAYYDSDTAVQVYVSGNIPDTEDNRRCFYGYMAPMYKRSATFRSPRLGYMTVPVNKVAGRLTLIQYISADSQEGGENKNGFEFSVLMSLVRNIGCVSKATKSSVLLFWLSQSDDATVLVSLSPARPAHSSLACCCRPYRIN